MNAAVFPRVALIVTALLVSPVVVWAEGPEKAQDPQVRRLVALARLSGEVHTFHPHVPYRGVAWDAALLATLPKVVQAQTSEAYGEAVSTLLQQLKDPVTLLRRAEPELVDAGPPPAPLSFPAPSVLLVRLGEPGLQGDPDKLEAVMTKAREMLQGARAVVFDLRLASRAKDPASLTAAVESLSDVLTPRPFPAPAQHYLVHSGLRGDVVAADTSTSTFSGYLTEFAGTYLPSAQATPPKARKRVVFLLNRFSPVPPLSLALSRGNVGFVLSEGPLVEDSLVRVRTVDLGEGLFAQVRASDLVFLDGTSGARADLELPTKPTDAEMNLKKAIQVAQAQLEPIHRRGKPATPHLPSIYRSEPLSQVNTDAQSTGKLEIRLFSLFKLWNALRLFHPSRDLAFRREADWDQVLADLIARVLSCKDETEYVLLLAELLGKIPDGNARLRGSLELSAYLGHAAPPIAVRLIGNSAVVTEVLDDLAAQKAGIGIGDAIYAVDGEDVLRRAERLARYLPASTQAARMRVVGFRLLRGAEGSQVNLTLRDDKNQVRMVRLVRSREYAREKVREEGEAMRLLGKDKLGYIDLVRLPRARITSALERFKDTKGLILDLRGVPKEPTVEIASRIQRLDSKNGPLAVVFEQSHLLSAEAEAGAVLQITDRVPQVQGGGYKGKVVVLVDERTAGEGEQVALLLRQAGARLVGGVTAGIPGDVTTLALHGGLSVSFSAVGVREPEGPRVQGRGIVPDVDVRLSAAGIRAGKDEILELAQSLLLR